ncbi:MAG: hypothetical protein RLZZ28_1643 [Bacteroidota bacterium]|jgi:hypothetical protein
MLKRVRGILKQPLFHFFFIGALLFALYYLVNPAPNNRETIVINDEQLTRLQLVFEKEWNRKPTEEELKGLLTRYIQQEVYYRKALRMHLDENDEIIRRRLEQKLRFVTNDMANLVEPNAEDLQKFYAANKSRYLEPKKYSFTHIFFSPDKRKNPEEDARRVLKSLPPLPDNNPAEWIKKGDLFPFASEVDSLSAKELDQSMGDGFSAKLDTMPIGKWVGPVVSGYGSHLIFIKEIKVPAEKNFSLIRESLLRDYQYQLQNDYNTRLFNEFRKDYTIEFNVKDPKFDKQLLTKLAAGNE